MRIKFICLIYFFNNYVNKCKELEIKRLFLFFLLKLMIRVEEILLRMVVKIVVVINFKEVEFLKCSRLWIVENVEDRVWR